MAIWQFTLVLVPQCNNFDFSNIYTSDGYDVSPYWYFFRQKRDLINEINLCLNLNHDDLVLIHWGNEKTTDIQMIVNEIDGSIEDLRIRIDVRGNDDLKFLEKIVHLSDKYDLLMLNIGQKKTIGNSVFEIQNAINHFRASKFTAL